MSRLATEAVTDPNRRLEAVDMSAEAVTIARGLGDPDLLASTLSKHCSVVMASFTDPRGCASISGELVDPARGRPDPALGLSASPDHCQTTPLGGDLETSDRYLQHRKSVVAGKRWSG